MARRPRIWIPDISVHVIQRGNNGGTIFTDTSDHEVFLDLLRLAAAHHRVSVHGFVQMTTHYHLLATPGDEHALPGAIKYLAGNYCQYYNRRHKRIGTLWAGRYRGLPILDEWYWLTCLRYIEQNPVRAHMVDAPDAYRWSSYRFHASGIGADWLVEHAVYAGLGWTPELRQAAYKAICNVPLTEHELGLQRHVRGQTLYELPASSARAASGSGTGLAAV